MAAHRARAWPAVALLVGVVTGCSFAAPPVRACTDIGSPAGVAVTIEPEVARPGLGLTLRICQADCTDRTVDLNPGSVTVGTSCSPGSPDSSCSVSSSPDGTLVGFADVDTLTAGAVRLSGELRTTQAVTRLVRVTVVAEPTYPNGPDCPAGGVQASVRLTAAGLR